MLFLEFEGILELFGFVCTYCIRRFFLVWEKVIPCLNFGSTVFFLNMTRWSFITPAVFRVLYTERSFETTELAFLGKIAWFWGRVRNGPQMAVLLVSECLVNLRTYNAPFTFSRSFSPSSRLANFRFASDWIVCSTNPGASV